MLSHKSLYRLISMLDGDPEDISWEDFKYLVDNKLIHWDGGDTAITDLGKRAVNSALERVEQLVKIMVKA